MADAFVKVALNIGSQRVTMGVFESAKDGGLILKKYDSSEILADPKAEAARLPQLGIAIRELVEKLEIPKGSEVRYAISGQSVFTRFIKLPPIETDDLEKVVGFEAQQHVPFPINEVIWDWEAVEGDDTEKEVILVAIKSDALNEIDELVRKAGLVTHQVDTSPLALYNALRYNYPEIEETNLLVDIGAKTSNLIYADKKQIFVRSVPVGGSSITTGIAKHYNIDFSEAENQKCTNGLVVLNTVHTTELDEATASLGTVIRNSLSKLPAEIARTTNYYRSNYEGKPPQHVLLAGAGTNLPYITEFFKEKLRVNVAYFNPLKRLSVGSSVDAEKAGKEAHLLGELVGLALRGVEGYEGVNIDLVPESLAKRREDQRRRPWLLGAAAAFILALAGWAGFNGYRNAQAKEELTKLQTKVDERSQFSQPLQRITNQEKNLEQVSNQIVLAQNARSGWIDIWDDLGQHFLSDTVWLVDFKPVVMPEIPKDAENLLEKAKPVITDNFYGQQYGASAVASFDEGTEARNPRNRKKSASPEIRAVVVKGFWRGENGHKEVTRLINQLRDRSQFFEVMPTDKTIISLPTTLAEGALAAPFEIILPLKNSLPAKRGKPSES